ncbi:MAG: VanZ family protein [Erysipelothrix sp.]|jgi:glycopeptide antibiotics resistance protein|nr:VanZ family protein [Erysipelothrix sp.]
MILDVLVLLILYLKTFYKKWKAKGKQVLIVNTLMYVYVGMVLYFTLMPIVGALPFIFSHPYVWMNMHLFSDVILGRGDFVRQIVLNVVMMMPFGFLLPLVKEKTTNLFKVIGYTFLFSLTIEMLQPLINGFRMADVTDLVTNTAGGILGYLIYKIFKPLVDKVLAAFA